ncbi:ATP-dependent DNA helicase DinG [Lysobacter korlensis]|uniref:ATP-dependent DNA helicase DinG n=1 Tax=Lysobacter korlensis TaxID=553636 RepID=A0ABV6RTB7_9GAMM
MSSPPLKPRVLDEEAKTAVRQAYEQVTSRLPGFKARRSQRNLIATSSRALGASGGFAVAEAPTGTGKSLGYLIAGIPTAQIGKRKLVLSTATVALQSQLMSKDLPAFLAATGSEAKVALAKGRGRYLCVRDAMELAGGQTVQADLGLELPSAGWPRPPQLDEIRAVEALVSAFDRGSWNGDLDEAPRAIPDSVRPLLSTTSGACANSRCAHAQRCPVLNARRSVRDADIVVANHAMVIAALELDGNADADASSENFLIGDPSACTFVFDEGHHLASVAIESGASQLHMGAFARRLAKMGPVFAAPFRLLDKTRIGNRELADAHADLKRLTDAVKAFDIQLQSQWTPDFNERDPMWRAPLGRIPDDWRIQAQALGVDTRSLRDWLEAARRRVMQKEGSKSDERAIRAMGTALEQLGEAADLFTAWGQVDPDGEPPHARWMTVGLDKGLVCHASPVSAAKLLRQRLWSQADSVLLTSATLSAGGNFRAFAASVGLPAEAECVSLPSPFDLQTQAVLQVPAFPVLPDHADHPKAIAEWLATGLDWSAGSLVLFTSRRKMEAVAALMPASRQSQIRVQGSMGKQALVDAHCAAVDAGQGSVLFGLASLGEGLDLARDYCSTVVITQLPFAVPTEPVLATKSEWLESRGHNPFMLVTVPDAIRVLTQYAGRLIRTSEDTGRIVLLDRRVVQKRYGRDILDALPPFRREITY